VGRHLRQRRRSGVRLQLPLRLPHCDPDSSQYTDADGDFRADVHCDDDTDGFGSADGNCHLHTDDYADRSLADAVANHPSHQHLYDDGNRHEDRHEYAHTRRHGQSNARVLCGGGVCLRCLVCSAAGNIGHGRRDVVGVAAGMVVVAAIPLRLESAVGL